MGGENLLPDWRQPSDHFPIQADLAYVVKSSAIHSRRTLSSNKSINFRQRTWAVLANGTVIFPGGSVARIEESFKKVCFRSNYVKGYDKSQVLVQFERPEGRLSNPNQYFRINPKPELCEVIDFLVCVNKQKNDQAINEFVEELNS